MRIWGTFEREYARVLGMMGWLANALHSNAEMAVRKMLKQSVEKLGTATLSACHHVQFQLGSR